MDHSKAVVAGVPPGVASDEDFDYFGNMKISHDTRAAVERLVALGQTTRLEIFRLLVEAGRSGLAAGAIGARLGLPPATLSFHLAQLSQAGLLSGERLGRSIIYRANYAAVNELIGYLTRNCCRGEAKRRRRAAHA